MNTEVGIVTFSGKVPEYKTQFSSGVDLSAYTKGEDITIKPGEILLIPTGIMLDIPFNYEAQIRPRSGLAYTYGITVLNSPGTIDADYRGEIKVLLINMSRKEFIIKDGMRIAQMVFCPIVRPKFVVKDLSTTTRGTYGFGSTGY
jgi:dUTP pyrophosphatase